MSKKAYSEQERKQVGQDLLSVGLEMLSQRGLKGTKLQDILQAVGISKPFFYGNYYASLAELVLTSSIMKFPCCLRRYGMILPNGTLPWRIGSTIF